MFEGIIQGMETLMSVPGIASLLIGSTVGFFFGLIPGLTGGIAMALLVPLTWGLSPTVGMFLIAGAMGASSQGASIPAILINIPGTPSRIVVTLDGFSMTRQGGAARALGLAASSTGFGALFGIFVLVFILPIASPIIRSIAAPEIFWLILLALILLSFVSRGNMWRGLAAGLLGLHFSWIGFSKVVGTARFIGDSVYLFDGIPRIPFVIIGLLAIPEILTFLGSQERIIEKIDQKSLELKATLAGFMEAFKYPFILIGGSIIGVITGIIPGVGPGTATIISYSLAQRFSKYRSKLGTGHPAGIVAAEAPGDAVEGASLIPTFLFGIPGSGSMVVLLGAFMLHGIQPGPAMFIDHRDIIWSFIIALVISNLWSSFVLVFVRGFFVRVCSLPVGYIAAFVLVMGLAGSYSLRQNIWDVLLVISTGLLGYTLKRFNFSVLPMSIAFILGPLFEKSFFQAYGMGYNSFSIFFTRPICILLILTILILLLSPLTTYFSNKYEKV